MVQQHPKQIDSLLLRWHPLDLTLTFWSYSLSWTYLQRNVLYWQPRAVELLRHGPWPLYRNMPNFCSVMLLTRTWKALLFSIACCTECIVWALRWTDLLQRLFLDLCSSTPKGRWRTNSLGTMEKPARQQSLKFKRTVLYMQYIATWCFSFCMLGPFFHSEKPGNGSRT